VNKTGYDGHCSVRLLTDATGAVTDRYDYNAFGNLLNQTGSTPNLYLYSGEQNDPNLGFYYLRARYLSGPTGRFWTTDPNDGDQAKPMTLHRYAYASDDQVNGSDPTGKAVFVATRPLNDPVGGFFRNVADHVFLVFTDGGVTDMAAWSNLVSNKNGLQYPWNGSGVITFSFHPSFRLQSGPRRNAAWQ
jgi:RHS repeat-associated protein